MTTSSFKTRGLALLVASALSISVSGQGAVLDGGGTKGGTILGPIPAQPADSGGSLSTGSTTFQWVRGGASLICSYLDLQSHATLMANVQDAGSSGFLVFATMGFGTRFDPRSATLLGWAPTDGAGTGSFFYDLPLLDLLPFNFEIELHGMYVDGLGHLLVTNPVSFLLNPMPVEPLDFDWAPNSVANPAGMIVAEQWASMGMHVSATNKTVGHPNKAILFDSEEPTGDDFDLVTPGWGPQNDTAYGMLLIVPENDYDLDADGLVDFPDDEAGGGVIIFNFDELTLLAGLTLIDIDLDETVQIRGFRGEALVMDLPITGIGDNSAMDIGFPSEAIDSLEVDFSGSGAIAELGFIPCPATVNFDYTSTGAPMAMQRGEQLTTQYLSSLGIQTSAISFRAGGTNKVILFDSENPTGGDFDLVTPGYHPTNTKAQKMVLILARDDVDLDFDGLVDDPNDDELGGIMIFDFDTDVVFHSATVLDIDNSEPSFFEAYDSDGILIGSIPLANLGDNSIQTVYPEFLNVRRVELHLGGSGALVDLVFCRDAGLSM